MSGIYDWHSQSIMGMKLSHPVHYGPLDKSIVSGKIMGYKDDTPSMPYFENKNSAPAAIYDNGNDIALEAYKTGKYGPTPSQKLYL